MGNIKNRLNIDIKIGSTKLELIATWKQLLLKIVPPQKKLNVILKIFSIFLPPVLFCIDVKTKLFIKVS